MGADFSSLARPNILETSLPIKELIHGSEDFDKPRVSRHELYNLRGLNRLLEALGHLNTEQFVEAGYSIAYPDEVNPGAAEGQEILVISGVELEAKILQASVLKLDIPEAEIPEKTFWSLGFIFKAITRSLRGHSSDIADSSPETGHIMFIPMSSIVRIVPLET